MIDTGIVTAAAAAKPADRQKTHTELEMATGQKAGARYHPAQRAVMVAPRGVTGPATNDNAKASGVTGPSHMPAHDKDMAGAFLSSLDPGASRFTFQFFGDGAGTYAEIFHGTLDEVWPKVQALNTPTRRCGAFVTINETDFKGRRSKNIVRTRALFVDADSDEQVKRCIKTFYAAGAAPSRTVKSGRGLHFYFGADVPLDQFSELQKALINKVGTDPAIHDLPRVMRLPGTLHLKDPTNPRLVKLSRSKKSPRWKFAELVATLGLSPTTATAGTPKKTNGATNVIPFLNAKPAAAFAALDAVESLAEGLRHENVPLDIVPLIDGCMFIREAIHTGGKDYAQPLWNLTTLAAAFLKDGHDFAHAMGSKHPKYSREDTDALWERKLRERKDRGLGWPSCNAIQSNGCTDCATCPHLSKGKSPLNLTHPVAPAVLATTPDPDRPTQVSIAGVMFRDFDRYSKPRPTLANAVIAINNLWIKPRLNLFKEQVTVKYNGESPTIREGLFTDETIGATRSMINNTYKLDPGDATTFAALKEIARANAFDPVLDMLDDCQCKWDGVKRLNTWVSVYLGVVDTALNRAIGRAALIAACRRARVPGCKFDFITVLEGPEGTDKSTAVRVLAGDEYFSDQTILGKDDKQIQETLLGIWMHENADLAGMRKADVESVKAFASRQVDRARPAYGRIREDRPRRSIEWGTTNNETYLQSQTGNRRWWTLKTGKIDIDALRRDRDQLIGEAAKYEAAGESITLDPSLWGDAREAQEARRVTDPWEDLLSPMTKSVTVYDAGTMQSRLVTIVHKSGDGYERVASADVLTYVLQISKAQQTPASGQRLAYVMEHAGWGRNPSGRVSIGGVPVRGYIRIACGSSLGQGIQGVTGSDEPTGASSAQGIQGVTGGSGRQSSPLRPL